MLQESQSTIEVFPIDKNRIKPFQLHQELPQTSVANSPKS